MLIGLTYAKLDFILKAKLLALGTSVVHMVLFMCIQQIRLDNCHEGRCDVGTLNLHVVMSTSP